MSDELREQIFRSLSLKETDELIKIWQANDHVEWADITFDVIREILQERRVELPPQNKPVLEAHDAIKFYQNALDSAREIGDGNKEASALGNMGAIYLQLRQEERAIEFYEQALALFRQIGNRIEETTILINLGTAHFLLGQFERVLDYDNQALAICRETGNRSKEAMILKIIGQVFFAMKQFDKAMEVTQSAVGIYDEIGDPGAGSAREQLKKLSAPKSRKTPYLVVVPIGLILFLFFTILSRLNNPNNNSKAITSMDQISYVSMEELYRNIPVNFTGKENWVQWENNYVGKYVKGKGKCDSVWIYPNAGKLFVVITNSIEEGASRNNTSQVALLIEDAHNINLGEKEGSFFIDSSRWIYLGEQYSFEGRVSGFSLFDTELGSSDYRDLIIVKMKLEDLGNE